MSDDKYDDLTDEELRRLAIQLDAVNKEDEELNEITTDDELHQWIYDKLDLNIPRAAVCPDHDAPFDFIADLFFKRVDAALVMANRGGGKSYLAAVWSFLNLYWEPGVECLHVGAIEIQAKRVYAHVKLFQAKAADDKLLSTSISETLWNTGSKVEIVTGSLSSVNGPHSQKVHRDEIELMDKQVYEESLQIERAKTIKGRDIESQTLLTSTRKTSDGLMQKLLDECEFAVKEGRRPPFKVYKFCIKECIKAQPSCRVANPDLPEDEKCDCNEVRNGEWQEGKPRTFDTVCNGSLVNADGFIPLNDVHKTFLKSSKAMWEAQQECKRPYTEDITLPEFSKEKHGMLGFELDPANGPIYMGIDFGGTNPHAVEWIQVLSYEVETLDFNGQPKRLKEGTRVVFNEIYRAEIGNVELANMITAIETEYRYRYPKFRVRTRFADPQAKAARLDFKAHDPPLLCSWPAVTRDKEEHLKRMRSVLVDGKFAVALDDCPMFVEEIEVWNINNKRKGFDHAVDSVMYAVSNIFALEQRHGELTPDDIPGSTSYRHHRGIPNTFDDSIPGSISSPITHVGSTRAQDKWN